eukprot:2109031-Prymnesium_polylepis.3
MERYEGPCLQRCAAAKPAGCPTPTPTPVGYPDPEDSAVARLPACPLAAGISLPTARWRRGAHAASSASCWRRYGMRTAAASCTATSSRRMCGSRA